MKLAKVHPDKQVLRQNNNKQKERLRPVGKARGEIRAELTALLLSKLTSKGRLTTGPQITGTREVKNRTLRTEIGHQEY